MCEQVRAGINKMQCLLWPGDVYFLPVGSQTELHWEGAPCSARRERLRWQPGWTPRRGSALPACGPTWSHRAGSSTSGWEQVSPERGFPQWCPRNLEERTAVTSNSELHDHSHSLQQQMQMFKTEKKKNRETCETCEWIIIRLNVVILQPPPDCQ